MPTAQKQVKIWRVAPHSIQTQGTLLNKSIYHLASPEDSDKLEQTGTYSAPSLSTEGFIHCCTGNQLPGVIQRYYIDATELILLHINPELLSAELVYENTVGGTEAFPHVYGEINKNAVIHRVIVDQADLARIAASEDYRP